MLADKFSYINNKVVQNDELFAFADSFIELLSTHRSFYFKLRFERHAATHSELMAHFADQKWEEPKEDVRNQKSISG